MDSTTILQPDLRGAPKLHCDEMLASLARWLRAAGHDTTLAPSGTPDPDILAQCRREQRTLLTRDRALAETVGLALICLLATDRLDEQAHELVCAGLDWHLAPFTRCMADNTPLLVAPSDKSTLAPPPFRERPGDIRFCPTCERIYWPGGHVRRMLDRLGRWANPPSKPSYATPADPAV